MPHARTWERIFAHATDPVALEQEVLYVPIYSPRLNPIEMLWRHFRREVTHCELFETKQAPRAAAQACFDRFNQCLQRILSVIGSNAAQLM